MAPISEQATRLSVLIIGHGAIGSWVAAQLQNDQNISIDRVLCRPGRTAAAEEAISGARAITDVSELDRRIDFAVECAGHDGLSAHGPSLLLKGIDLAVTSVGAFSDPQVLETLDQAAKEGSAQIEVLSGAIGAVDALAAARIGGLSEVTYTGRKPPIGWRGSVAETVLDLEKLTSSEVHFSGTAREAARRYPKNANVAATVALAGIGLDETHVELVADPALTGNRHEVTARGLFGQFSFTIDGKALASNPGSSALTAMSVVRAVRNRACAIRI
jgi:aspartate dehydrogenase